MLEKLGYRQEHFKCKLILTTKDIKTLLAILYTVADYCNPVLSKRCLKS